VKIDLDYVTTDKMSKHAADTSGDKEESTQMIQLCIEDTGKGMSKEFVKTKLFQPFAQEDHLATGTGLGLSLVQSILRLLNGDIEVQSTIGKLPIVTKVGRLGRFLDPIAMPLPQISLRSVSGFAIVALFSRLLLVQRQSRPS
jgi:hypothetical protein